jgi:hypothetical protein
LVLGAQEAQQELVMPEQTLYLAQLQHQVVVMVALVQEHLVGHLVAPVVVLVIVVRQVLGMQEDIHQLRDMLVAHLLMLHLILAVLVVVPVALVGMVLEQ